MGTGRFQTLVGHIFAYGGPCLVAYGILFYLRTRNFMSRSVEVAGVVVRLEHSKDRMGTASYDSYAPVFSFTALDGKKITVTSDVASSPADFCVGESVRVLYDPADPENARIHSFFQIWGGPLIFSAAGALFASVGLSWLGLAHWP
jgi:hypothetical protein